MMKAGEKNRLVLEAAAKAAGWGTPPPAGVGRGLAVVEGFGSYAAGVAEVSVAPDGGLKVLRYVVAIDSGHFVNPDTCAAQAESNAVYGLGALTQACSVRDGRIEQSNFHDFPLPLIGDMPRVELVLAPTGGFWGGHGEPGILPFQAAVLNAVYALSGKRIRSLPLRKEDLRKA
jgi:isoquinoline 1-oxidoreductase beta subunit